MARKKKKKHENITISAPLAYVSAIEALQIARSLALERKDHTSLIDIANSWIEMGQQLLTAEVELVYDDEDESSSTIHSEPTLMGFGFTAGGHNGPEEETKPSPNPSQN